YPLDEQAESLTGILEDQRRAGFEAFMPLKEGFREEACQMPSFANVNTDVEGFVQQQRDGFEVSTLGSSFSHGSFLLGWQPGNAHTMFFGLIITAQVYSTPGRRQGQG